MLVNLALDILNLLAHTRRQGDNALFLNFGDRPLALEGIDHLFTQVGGKIKVGDDLQRLIALGQGLANGSLFVWG